MRTAGRLSVTMGIVMGMLCLTGCGQSAADGKIEVELVSYKPEAVAAFEQIEERFNATHDNIHLTIDSPNEILWVSGETSTTPVFWMPICLWTSRIWRRWEW